MTDEGTSEAGKPAQDPGRDPARDPARFVGDDFEAAYLPLVRDGLLDERVARARALLSHCVACPRACGVDRTQEGPCDPGDPGDLRDLGDCRIGRDALVASAFAHQGEEACLVGRRGSGTIFFSRCNLHCVFCQNFDLSQQHDGQARTPAQIADLALQLEQWGCHNINFVTPEHVVPQVVEAICLAAERGLTVPIVYNTSAYDSVASLRLLEGLVDIYMPDLKFWEPTTARCYCGAEDYPEHMRAAMREMQRQVGCLRLDTAGIARRGLLVRHLVMPGLLSETTAIMNWLAREISPDTYVNVMGQYRPAYLVGQPAAGADAGDNAGKGAVRFPELNRRPSSAELGAAAAAARAAGLWRLEGAC